MTGTIEIIATVATLIFILYGITSQIKKNFQLKSVKGLSAPFFLMSFVVWCSWSLFGFMAAAIFMGIIQTFGALMTVVILLQFLIYSQEKRSCCKETKEREKEINRWQNEGGC